MFDRVDGILNSSRKLMGADWKEIKVLGTQIVRMLWDDGSVSHSVDIYAFGNGKLLLM